jgi:hypothetical protein
MSDKVKTNFHDICNNWTYDEIMKQLEILDNLSEIENVISFDSENYRNSFV